MIDSVIAGTGNSRFLRTSISASTTWEDALAMLRAGTFPIDLAGINIDGYVTVGTPLNAETLLKEAVITALDLDDNATPSDAWEKLIAIVNTKADADSVVTAITYDSAEKKLYATINGTPTLVTTFNFTTPQEAADSAPVQSVAGKTGTVALNAEDVAYAEGTTYSDNTVGKALADDDARMGEIEGDITGINNELDAFEQDVEDNYARIDGYYEEMTVGNAEQLVATVGIDDNSPYLFRTTGGSADVGDRKTMEIIGGTFAWNQLQRSPTEGGVYAYSYSGSISTDGDIITNTATGNTQIDIKNNQNSQPIAFKKGHCYYIGYDVKCSEAVQIKTYFKYALKDTSAALTANTWRRFGDIAYWADNNENSFWDVVTLTAVQQGTTLSVRNLILIDLTLMLGSTIADYVFTLESSHAGDGVAWVKRWFPKEWYTYNPGELMSVKTSANITTGFNAYNHAEGVAKLVGGNAYQITGTYTALSYSTGEAITPNESGYFTPSDSGVLTVAGGNATTTCVHLVWDGERDGEYEAYVEHNYPLDNELELRGLLKLNENNELYYDGDVYQSDGTVTRKYGVIDMGTLGWNKNNSRNNFYSALPGSLGVANGVVANGVSSKYVAGTYTEANGTSGQVSGKFAIAVTTKYIYLYDEAHASDDAETFTASVSGVYLVYELATPTTEEADPFTSPEAVDDFGTEQFVDTRDVPILVGHNSVYQANLRAKLEMAPDSPDGDGDYLVRQTNGTNAYVPYIVPTAGEVNFDSSAEYDDGTVGAELNNKADVDGYYETLTAGLAENLVATVGVDDSVPYIFRTTGGSADVGDRKEMTVVGGTLFWNQMAKPKAAGTRETGGITFVSDGLGGISVSGEATGTATNGAMETYPTYIAGHKYLIMGCPSGGAISGGYNLRYNSNGFGETGSGTIVEAISSGTVGNRKILVGSNYPIVCVTTGAQIETAVVFKPQVFDLTWILGVPIANYLYGLNDATAVAWFKKLFPEPFYQYDTGTWQSVNTSANKTIGFNAFNGTVLKSKQWNSSGNFVNATSAKFAATETKIRCVPNTTYCIAIPNVKRTSSLWGEMFDINGDFLRSLAYVNLTETDKYCTITTSADAHYFSFTMYAATNYTDAEFTEVNVNISWDGEKDGEYEPYEERTYTLDSELELKGTLHLDANNELYYYGDTYDADGTVTRKFFEYTVTGDETFNIASTSYIKSDASNAYIRPTGMNTVGGGNAGAIGAIGNEILTYSPKSLWSEVGYPNMFCLNAGQLHLNIANGLLGITDYTQETTSTAIEKIKAYCKSLYDNGTPLKFILPYEMFPTETATPYISPQVVNDFGTEEFVDASVAEGTRDVAVPVGHDTTYAANLRAKLEMSPDSPSGDGDYIVRQSDGVNEYVPMPIPAAPSENGTYVLKVTVSGGTASYSWEAQT